MGHLPCTASVNDNYRPGSEQSVYQFAHQKHQEGGIYPMWDLGSNYTGTMIGYHAVPVIVDAYMKGYRNFDAKEAYKASLRAAEYDTTGIKCPALVLPHLMPKAKYYKNAIGYIPCDRENESVAKALEYAYDDWCISIFAEAMSDFETKAKYERFAKAYEFYFDKSTRFMRGLDSKVNGVPRSTHVPLLTAAMIIAKEQLGNGLGLYLTM